MLRYAILGPVELYDGDQRLALGGPRQVALLAFLLVRANRATATDELIDALWGGQRSAGAVKRLQVAVARLRRALGADGGGPSPLRTVSDGYLLAVEPGELDVDVFQARMEEGRGGLDAGDPARAREALCAALALWRGPALAEVAYESFAQGEIRRLEELRLVALEARVDADLQVGRHAAVIAELEGLIAAHPTRERLAGLLMLAYYRCGRQTDALDLYRRTQVMLDAEFGLQPGPALAALQQQVLEHSPALQPAARAAPARGRTTRLPPPLRSAPPSPYVGRSAERAKLLEVARAAHDGSRRIVFLGGEPGVGKTRLAAHTALQAHGMGFSVGWGACVEGVSSPYATWIGALSHLVGQAPDDVLARHVAEHGGETSRLVRPLRQRVTGIPPPQRSDPETERYLLFAGIAGLLEGLCSAGPMALVLDDLDWADKESLDLLRYVAATTPADLPLLIVATYRDSDLHARHPLTPVLAELHRVQGVERLVLTGLCVDDVVELMAPGTAHHLDPGGRSLAGEIAVETGGNPFFVGELLRHLRESGAIIEDHAGRRRLRAPLASLGLPQSVREVVLRRVGRLGARAEAVLTLAAVVGQTFDLRLLERLTDADEDQTLAALEAATDGAILVESPDEAGRFAFAHALIKHALYGTLSVTRRSILHRRVAEALETVTEADPGELAQHWSLAGAPGRAGDHARVAGERALEQLAPDVALRWFTRAFELFVRAGAGEADRCDALIGLGEAKRRVGDATFRHNLLKASRIAARLDDHERLTRAVLANTLGPFGAAGPPDRLRVQTVELALTRVPEDWPWRPRMIAVLARELYFGGEPGRGSQLSVAALARARRRSDRRELARVAALAASISPIAPLGAHGELVRELAALAEEIGDPELRFQAASVAFIYGMHSGDPVPLAGGVNAMLSLAAAIGHPILHWTSLWAHSAQRTLAGDLAAGEALTMQGAAAAREQRQPQGFLITFGQLLAIRTEQNRLDELREPLDHLLAKNPRLPVLRLAVGFIDGETGRLERAEKVLAQAAADGFPFPFDRTLAFSLARCADIALRVGSRELAPELYDRLLPYRAQCATPAGISSRGSVELNLGRLATMLGRDDAALEHLAAAQRVHERLRAPLLRARTSLAWGEALLAQGERERAAARLGDALDLARRHGSTALEREARAMRAPPAPAGRH